MKENIQIFCSIIFLIIVVVPALMIASKPQEFLFLNLGITFEIIFFLIITPSIFILPLILQNKERTFLNAFLWFLLSWILLSGLILPLVKTGGMKDIQELKLNFQNLIFVFIGSTIFTFLIQTKVKKIVLTFLIIFTFSSFISSFPSLLNLPIRSDSSKIDKFYRLSKNKNLIVLSFDGIPNYILKKVFSKNPELQLYFKDFIYFDNIVSQSPSTLGSIRSELFGNQNYHLYGDKNEEVNSKIHLNDAIMNSFDDSFSYSEYNTFQPNPKKMIIPGELINSKNIENHILFFKFIFARIFSPNSFLLFSKLDLFNLIYFFHNDKVIEMEKSHIGIKWKTQYLKQKIEYDKILENSSIENSPLSIRYLHFTFTHFPVDFDENCNFRGNNGDWYLSNQNEEGLINESICSVKLFIKFIDKLKTLGIYDKTFLIIKSDHGEPVYYFSNFPENLKINNNNLGYNRYRPILLIKQIESTQSSLQLNSKLTSLSNLSKTICETSFLDTLDCSKFKGFNLFKNDKNIQENFYLEVAKNEKSDFMFDDHETLKFQVTSNHFLELLKSQSNLDLKEYNPLFFPYLSKRLDDLSSVKLLLESYHAKYGKYPVSKAWDGYITIWGYSGKNWIPDLISEFTEELPIDPSPNENEQYLYKSDGKDYKLIFHESMDECSRMILKEKPHLVDPARSCWAYGYWTKGAKKW
jgi:hypothetical protein